jgi:hypothetical protein
MAPMTEPPADSAAAEPADAEGAAEDVRPPEYRGRSLGLARRGLPLWWLLLLALVGAGVLVGPSIEHEADALANPDPAAADAVGQAFGQLPPGALVLVAMDADLGTYPEIRGTTVTALEDLLRRGASLAFVSVSVEGRAIAAAQLEALRSDGVPAERLLDLGFVSGAEAGMVRLVDGALRPGMTGPLPALVAQRGGGIGAFDLILLVGGSDIGPRTWVEQVGTRLPARPMVAIAPTFAQPELAPYLRTGQLSGLLATIRDDAAYVRGTTTGDSSGLLPSAFALRIGMLVALVVLLRQLALALPRLRGGSPAPEAVEQ